MLYGRHAAVPAGDVFDQVRLDTPNCSGRMDNLRAAILRPQLTELDQLVEAWNVRYRAIEAVLRTAPGVRLPERPDQESLVGSSIQFLVPGLDEAGMRKLVTECLSRGVELKWFGDPEPVAYTSRYDSWRYLGRQPLPVTDGVLASLLDMRIPLTFSVDDCRLIGQIIGDAELGLSTTDRPGERPESAAVSRRPSALLDRSVLEQLSRRTNLHGLAYFLGHYTMIGLGGWLCWATFPGPWFWPAFAFQAVVTGFLFSPLHECAHGSAFKSRRLNETVLWITALVYIVPPYFFRYFHLGHHRFTQVPGKDPSLVLPTPATFGQYLWYCAGLWFWWRNLTWMVKHAFSASCIRSARPTCRSVGAA